MVEKPRKLMRVVLKEEYVDLTGDAISALLLNQCIYWSEIVNDMDQETIKKIESYEKLGATEKANELKKTLKNGWFWKTAKEFHKEIMISSRGTVDRKLKELAEKGFIQCKKPEIRYKNGRTDNTNRYKVNLDFVQQELIKRGYSLDGYKLPETLVLSDAQNEQTEEPLLQSDAQNEQRSAHGEQRSAHHERTLTEITYSEITFFDDDEYVINRARENIFYSELAFFLEMKKTFNNKNDYVSIIKKLIEYNCHEFTGKDIKNAFNDLSKHIESISSPTSFFAKAISNSVKKAKLTEQRNKELEAIRQQRKNRDTSIYYNWLEEA